MTFENIIVMLATDNDVIYFNGDYFVSTVTSARSLVVICVEICITDK